MHTLGAALLRYTDHERMASNLCNRQKEGKVRITLDELNPFTFINSFGIRQYTLYLISIWCTLCQ